MATTAESFVSLIEADAVRKAMDKAKNDLVTYVVWKSQGSVEYHVAVDEIEFRRHCDSDDAWVSVAIVDPDGSVWQRVSPRIW